MTNPGQIAACRTVRVCALTRLGKQLRLQIRWKMKESIIQAEMALATTNIYKLETATVIKGLRW